MPSFLTRNALAVLCLGTLISLMNSPASQAATPAGNEIKVAQKVQEKARHWLEARCNKDGSFGEKPTGKMPGIVGLALYALATSSDKPDPKKMPALDRAAKYLVSQQMESGAIALKKFGLENYNTSVAALALKALNDPKYAEVLEKAKKYILSCQLNESNGYDKDKHNRAYGGFGYGSAKRADLSNTTFSLETLKALGIKEDSPAFKNALLFVKRCQDNQETNDVKEMKTGENTGAFVYLPGESEFGTIETKRGEKAPKPYGNMTYAGIKALIYCGLKEDSPELQAAWKWVKANYSVTKNPGGEGSKGYYYYLAVMAKAMTAGDVKEITTADGKKAFWAKDLALHLKKLQSPNGSFSNPDPKWMEDDPILSTSYALNALNLCIKAMK